MRAAIGDRGKRGGARVIYFLWAHDCCYLVFAYAKSEQSDLSRAPDEDVGRLMQEVLRNG